MRACSGGSGWTKTVSATDLILSMIEQDVEETGAVIHLMKLGESDLELVEFRAQQRLASRITTD